MVLQGRRWCFTYNYYTNYTDGGDAAIDKIVEVLNGWACRYAFQEEVGSKNGTPHLQGYVDFGKNPRKVDFQKRFVGMIIHWEIAIYSAEACRAYCTKDRTRKEGGRTESNMTAPRKKHDPLAGKTLYRFQQEIKDLCAERADPEECTIHWYWDPVGNCGKTALIKHLLLAEPDTRTMVGGASKDAAFAITQLKKVPECVFFNVVRSQEGFVSYAALEAIKDGLMFSPKYESGQWNEDGPHVFVFANFAPVESKLSAHRWHIVRVCKCFVECECAVEAAERAFVEGFAPAN